MLRTTPTAVFAFALSTTVLAQAPGSNDATFNPLDQGFGVGDPTPALNSGFALGGAVYCLASDALGRTIWGGSVMYSPTGVDGFLERRNADGSIDGGFHVGTDFYGDVMAVAVQADGKILVGGAFSTPAPNPGHLIRLNSDGTVDGTWSTGTGFSGGIAIRTIVVQPDGKILVGGTFNSYNGTTVQNLMRLNINGARDTSWPAPSGVNGAVHAIALRGDGGVAIGGEFTTVANQSRNRIARLTSTGALVSGFNPGTGCNAVVRALAQQADGSLVLGGDFTTFGGTPCGRIVRISSTGALDGGFAPVSGFNGSVKTLNLRSDGTILAGGTFTNFDGTSRTRLAVITSSGTLDPGFYPGSGPNYDVNAVVTLPSGKVFAVGGFTGCSGTTALRNVRLNPDGSLDNTYCYNGVNGSVQTVAVQGDGRILVGGNLSAINGVGAGRLNRIYVDGTKDPSFVPAVGGMSFTDAAALYMNQVLLQPDGRILVGGGLWAYDNNNVAGYGLVRLETNGAVDLTFNAGVNAYDEARAISLQADGRIIAATNYYTGHYNPNANSSLLKRYNSDGSTDPGFISGSTAAGLIERTCVMDDGRIMLIGGFTNYAGSGRNHILRLNSDGTIDGTFNYTSTGFTSGTPKHLLAYADGRCIISGTFIGFDGHPTTGLIRLNADGSFDPTFAPTVQGGGPLLRDYTGKLVLGARYRLNEDGSTDATFNAGAGFSNAYGPSTPIATALQQGGILAVGDFTAFNGIGRNRVARVTEIIYSDITLPIRALLEGPYVSATTLMNDGLRSAGLIPTTEPFTALGFTHMLEPPVPAVAASVFNPTTPVFNSIVDWVLVELRSATNPAQVLQTRSGLIQRDGDIVGTDGVSPLVFNQPLGSYYVAVRHRNHAGCMTAAPIALSSTNPMLNFSLPTTATYGAQGLKTAGTRTVLWAGDATHDGTLKYTGSTNDRDPLLVKVGSSTPNATAPGYFPEDVNMDGTVKYTGSANDRDPILVNVGSTTPTSVRLEQLP